MKCRKHITDMRDNSLLSAQSEHLVDADLSLGDNIIVENYLLAVSALEAVENVGDVGDLHIVAHAVLGKGIEHLVWAVDAQVLNYAVLGTDDKGLLLAVDSVLHYLGGASRKIGSLNYRRLALGVDKHGSAGVSSPCKLDITDGKACMSGAAAAYELELLFGNHFLDIAAKVAVGNEQYLVGVHIFDYLHSGGRCNAHIAESFKLGCGVDVSHYLIIGISLLELNEHIGVKLVCHGAACLGLGEIYLFLGGKYLAGLRHEADAAHNNIFAVGFCCLYSQTEGIACKVCDLQNIVGLIAMSKNTGIFLFFKFQYFFLNVLYHDM